MSNLDDDPIATAQALGLELRTPEPNQLFLDIDTEQAQRVYAGMVEVLERNGIVVLHAMRTQSKGGHWHYTITLDRNLSDVERIAMQACLGSDRVREMLSLLRVLLNTKRPPTVFFEVPGAIPGDLPVLGRRRILLEATP